MAALKELGILETSNTNHESSPLLVNNGAKDDAITLTKIANTESLGYWESVETVLGVGLMPIIFGLGIGVYYCIPCFLPQFVTGMLTSYSGWLGLVYVVSGLFGTLCVGRAMDLWPGRILNLWMYLLMGAILSWSLFAWLVRMKSQNGEENETSAAVYITAVFVSVICAGFCLASILPVGFEMVTAITYPADEAAVAGILECAAELSGFLLVTLGGKLRQLETLNSVLIAVLILASLLLGLAVSKTHMPSKRPIE
jgi:MFS family permease